MGQATSAVPVGASILAPTRCHPAICSTFLKQIILDPYTQLGCIHGSAESDGVCWTWECPQDLLPDGLGIYESRDEILRPICVY